MCLRFIINVFSRHALHAIISEHVHAVIRKNILSGMYNEKQISGAISCTKLYTDNFQIIKHVCLIVFLCFWSLSSHSRIFHSYMFGDVTIAVEDLQSLTYARHPWPLSSEGSLP